MAIQDTLWKLFPIIYLMFGTFYNYYQFTNFVVKKYREENVFVFFFVLAFFDVLVLVVPLLHEWLAMAVNSDIRSLSSSGCHLHLWLSAVALDIPPWVLVIMAYEKRALLWFPVPADSRFSRHMAKRIMMLLVVVCMLRHSAYLLGGNFFNAITLCDKSKSNNQPNQTRPCKNKRELHVCDILDTSDSISSIVTFYNPWVDLAFRWLGPCCCLLIYNFAIVRKIYRERRCSEKLMEKVGIVPPPWFHTGVLEMEATVRWTLSMALIMCVTTLPRFLHQILQPASFGSREPYSTNLYLIGCLLLYVNHSFLYPTFAVHDNELLVVMQETWRLPLARKRGTMTASRPPCLIPQHCTLAYHGAVNGDLNTNNSSFFPPSTRVSPVHFRLDART